MSYSLSFRPYRRPFARPMSSAHGRWEVRGGAFVRLGDSSGNFGYGEIAPIEDFGSPSAEACADICAKLGDSVSGEQLASDALPDCVRFAFGSAVAMLEGERPQPGPRQLARLLPSGPAAFSEVRKWLKEGARCFKYKLNGIPDFSEREMIGGVLDMLKTQAAKLRVDANGSLDESEAGDFLKWLRGEAVDALDFVEQPFRVGRESETAALMAETGVSLALDESVAGMDSLKTWLDWAGPIVVKPVLTGDPMKLRELLSGRKGRTVFSSAHESPIGLYGAMLALGEDCCEALGFGTSAWGEVDSWGRFTAGATLDPSGITSQDMEEVWQMISD